MHGNSKLTQDQVLAIHQALIDTDEYIDVIAQRFGTSEVVVRGIANKTSHRFLLEALPAVDLKNRKRMPRRTSVDPAVVMSFELAEDIRRRARKGQSVESIMLALNLKRPVVRNVLNRRTWVERD